MILWRRERLRNGCISAREQNHDALLRLLARERPQVRRGELMATYAEHHGRSDRFQLNAGDLFDGYLHASERSAWRARTRELRTRVPERRRLMRCGARCTLPSIAAHTIT